MAHINVDLKKSAPKASPSRPSLARNSAGVPGGLGTDLPEPVEVGDVKWTPADAGPWASPIGTALAAEMGTPSQ